MTNSSCYFVFSLLGRVQFFIVLMFTFTRVATGQEMVLEKILQGHGKAMEFYLESGKIDILKKSRGKLKYPTCTRK